MASQIKLNAQPRTVTGKEVRHLRRDGFVPFVVYGPKSEPIALQAAYKELGQVLLRAGNDHTISLQVEGEAAPRTVRAHEVQRHVTRMHPIHVDFMQVDD